MCWHGASCFLCHPFYTLCPRTYTTLQTLPPTLSWAAAPSSGSFWETPSFFLLQTLLAAPFTWNALPLSLHRASSKSSFALTLNVLSNRSPSWVSLSKQGLPVSLSPGTVFIPFLVLSTVCSHFTLLFTCLLCREGCSLHLPGQPSLFPAGLAGNTGFLRGQAFCCYFRSSRPGVWTRYCPGPTSSLRPHTLAWTVAWLPKHLWPWLF